MKTDYTPGPWVAYVEIDGSFEIKAPGEGITGWDLEICTRQGAFSRREELDSNARLIAAAPELLAALIALHAVASVEEDKNYAAVVNAAAVISKATGATP